MKERPILFSAPMVRAILSGAKSQTRRLVERGARQSWLTPATLKKVQRFAPSQDGWWTMAVGEPTRIVHCGHEMDGGHIGSVLCPYGVPGDRFWVRETWRPQAATDRGYTPDSGDVWVTYAADGRERLFGDVDIGDTWTLPKAAARGNVPGIHMPRWASRLTLEVTEVRVQRLQDISEEDARAEGMDRAAPLVLPGERIDDDDREDPREVGYGTGSFALQNFRKLWDEINGKRAPWATSPWVFAISFKRVTP